MTATSRKFVDLDAAYAEQDNAAIPLVVRLFGEEWELSGSIPAAVTLRLMVWQEKGWVDAEGNTSDDVTTTEIMAMLRDLVPKAVLDEWLARGLGTDKLELIIYSLLGEYEAHLQAIHGGAEGEAPPPRGGNRASRRSSNGGRSSKPTSSGSTKSSSRKR